MTPQIPTHSNDQVQFGEEDGEFLQLISSAAFETIIGKNEYDWLNLADGASLLSEDNTFDLALLQEPVEETFEDPVEVPEYIQEEAEDKPKSIRKRYPMSAEARERRNRKRRLIPDVKLPFQSVKILKNDIRRHYGIMMNNVVNSSDSRLITQFFQQFSHPDISILDIAPELVNYQTLPTIRLQCINNICLYFGFMMRTIPDMHIYMHDMTLKVNPITNESRLIGKSIIRGTKVFDDELPSSMIEELGKYFSQRKLQLEEDRNTGKILITQAPVDGTGIEVQLSKRRRRQGVTQQPSPELLQTINTPLDLTTIEHCNLLRPLAKPMRIEVEGSFCMHLDANGKIIKNTFLSQEALLALVFPTANQGR